MTKLAKFIEVFDVPPAMTEHINLAINEQEMDMVIGLSEGEKTAKEIAALLTVTQDEADELIQKALGRRVIAIVGLTRFGQNIDELEKPLRYKALNFYHRLNHFGHQEYDTWSGVPREARDAALDYSFDYYLEFVHKDSIATMRQDPDARVPVPNRDYLLLDEALEMVDAATDHAIVECDCRNIVDRCNYPRNNCIRLDQGARMSVERGLGHFVTKEEMRQIVIDADMVGLMHTGDRFWKEKDNLFGFCNCCACCCYPTQAGMRSGLFKTWPRVYFVAERDMDLCMHCGICAQRCHFDAFFEDEHGEIQFNADECRGCGICATACPEEAITMVKLREDGEKIAASIDAGQEDGHFRID